MNNRAKLIATLGASGIAAVVIATLALGADSHNGVHPDQDDIGAAPICTSASDVSGPTFYSEMTRVSARMHEGMESVASGDIDRDFMRMMVPHHQGAIDMALLQLKYGQDEKLKRLAQSIIVEQTAVEPPHERCPLSSSGRSAAHWSALQARASLSLWRDDRID